MTSDDLIMMFLGFCVGYAISGIVLNLASLPIF